MPDISAASETKYTTRAIISSRSVSVIEEWHRNLAYLNRRLLDMPPHAPMPIEARASDRKLSRMVKGVLAEKSKSA